MSSKPIPLTPIGVVVISLVYILRKILKVHGGDLNLTGSLQSSKFRFSTEETAVLQDSMMPKYILETNFAVLLKMLKAVNGLLYIAESRETS